MGRPESEARLELGVLGFGSWQLPTLSLYFCLLISTYLHNWCIMYDLWHKCTYCNCYDALCFFDGGSASLFSLSESHFVLLVEQSLVLSSSGLSFLVKWNDQRASSTSWGVHFLVDCLSKTNKQTNKKCWYTNLVGSHLSNHVGTKYVVIIHRQWATALPIITWTLYTDPSYLGERHQ